MQNSLKGCRTFSRKSTFLIITFLCSVSNVAKATKGQASIQSAKADCNRLKQIKYIILCVKPNLEWVFHLKKRKLYRTPPQLVI